MALESSIAIEYYHLDPPLEEEQTPLPYGSVEYAAVERLLVGSLKGYRLSVKDIVALHNPRTYEKFADNVELYRHKPGAVVMRLLHGTRPDNVNAIFESNLKLSKTNLTDENRNSKWYCGEGFYFTNSAPYACSPRFTGFGEKHLLLFDVLVGSVARLPRGKMYPPEGIDTTQPEDETVESYAKFGEDLFYPTHLIVCN
ncbi:uncharacterized protein LOC117645890 [Thrips palmi]|uniref:Poly [ADP-ribose] polymerase n=1 Tax=Thrips palmi TaxID=161013 RepID=A0A6P8YYI4_THRPL|nr:uncharacterized protein LOC117645890 [Thrips palmi]